jgi:ABC-type multidrug transport system permease subunit
MANIIRAVFALFWLAATCFICFLSYIVFQTEPNPQALWGWLVMCGFTFVSVTFLAYNIIFGHQARAEQPHHHTHLQNS